MKGGTMQTDAEFFTAHPGREFRVRPAFADEAERAPSSKSIGARDGCIEVKGGGDQDPANPEKKIAIC